MVLHIKAPLLQFLDTSSRKSSLYHPILSGLPGDPLLRLPELSFFPTLKAQVIPISHILLTDLLSLLIFKRDHGQSPLCSHHDATVWGVQETLDDGIHKWKCCLLFWEIADFPSLIPLYALALFQNLSEGSSPGRCFPELWGFSEPLWDGVSSKEARALAGVKIHSLCILFPLCR